MTMAECYFPLCSMKINRISLPLREDNYTYSQWSGFKNIWTQSHEAVNAEKKEGKANLSVYSSNYRYEFCLIVMVQAFPSKILKMLSILRPFIQRINYDHLPPLKSSSVMD